MYRLIIGILLGWSLSAGVVADVDKALAGELEVLAHSKLSQMPGQIEVLAAIDDSRVPVVLQALLDGRLYTRKSDRKVYRQPRS